MKILKIGVLGFCVFYAFCLAYYYFISDEGATEVENENRLISSTKDVQKENASEMVKHVIPPRRLKKNVKKIRSKYSNLSPGGAGWVMNVAVHPDDKRIMFICNDIGGVWRTQDGGQSFINVSTDLTTDQVEKAVCLPGTKIVYLATSDGFYKSFDLGDSWMLMENGMEKADHEFSHPVLDIEVCPNDLDSVWLTISEMISPDFRSLDPYVVYYSQDQGQTWEGMLYLDTTQVKGRLEHVKITVAVDPLDSNKVFVGSSIGLFSSPDKGQTWFELGNEHVFVSRDKGHSWTDCFNNPECPESYRKYACSDTESCLPKVKHAGFFHPSLSDVAVFNDGKKRILYALIQERSHLFDYSCNRYKKAPLDAHVTGGPWLSHDNGLTWKHYFREQDGSSLSSMMRCNENVEFYWNSTIYHGITVSPKDPYHFFVAARYLFGGVYEHLNGSWIYHADDDVCHQPGGDCYEGRKSQGLWANQRGPATKQISVVDWEKDRPDYVFGHSRGALYARFNEKLKRYEYDHMEQDVDGFNKGYWQTNGMSNFCTQDILWPLEEDHIFIVGGLDSGLLRTNNGGNSWKLLSVDDLSATDEARAIVQDEETNVLYASVLKNASSIVTSKDGGNTWQIIGGLCKSCGTDYGFPKTTRIFSLAVDYGSPAENRRLYAGTSEGLYIYEPVDGRPGWRLYRDSNFPSFSIEARDIYTSVSYPESALVSICDTAEYAKTNKERSAIRNGGKASGVSGVYLLTRSYGRQVSKKLTGGENPQVPTSMAVAKSPDDKLSLIVAGRFDWRPVVYQTGFDFPRPELVSWRIALDENMQKKMAGYKPVENYSYNKFRTIAVSPKTPQIVYVGMGTAPFYDHYKSQQAFVSHDGGQTFGIARELEDFHNKNFTMLKFNPKGDRLFLAPACGGLYSLNLEFLKKE